MRSTIERIFWTFLSLGVPAVIAVICTPILINRIGLGGFGFLSVFLALFAASGSLDLGLGRGLILFIEASRSSRESRQIEQAFSSGIVMMICLGVFVFGAAYTLLPWFLPQMEIAFEFDIQYQMFLFLSSFSLLSIFPSNLCKSYLEAEEKFNLLSLIRMSFGILYFLLPALLSTSTSNVSSHLYAIVLIRIIQSALMIWIGANAVNGKFELTLRFNRRTAKRMLMVSGWIFVSNIVAFVLSVVDRFFIGRLFGIEAVAIYSAPAELLSKLALFPGAIATVMFQRFAAIGANSLVSDGRSVSGRDLISLSIIVTSLLCALILLPISFFAEELLSAWLQGGYTEEMSLVLRIMCVGFYANFSAYLVVAHLNSVGRSKHVAIVVLSEIVIFTLILALLDRSPSFTTVCSLLSARMVLDWALLQGVSLKSRIKDHGLHPLILIEVPITSSITAILLYFVGLH